VCGAWWGAWWWYDTAAVEPFKCNPVKVGMYLVIAKGYMLLVYLRKKHEQLVISNTCKKAVRTLNETDLEDTIPLSAKAAALDSVETEGNALLGLIRVTTM